MSMCHFRAFPSFLVFFDVPWVDLFQTFNISKLRFIYCSYTAYSENL